MVTYETIKGIGYNLRKSDIKTISISKLYSILRQATGSHRGGTLKHYVKMLKEEGFIKFNNQGVWEIVRNK